MSDVQNLLKELLKVSGNEFASIVSDGTVGDVHEYIDTGCFLLNAQISGDMFKGIPVNRTIGLCGEESVGKTFFAASIAKNFLDKYKEGIVVYFDSENAVSKEFFSSRGMDINRVLLMPVGSIEDFREQALGIVNKLNEQKDKKVMFILDSLAALPSNKEISDIEKGDNKVDLTRQRIIRSTFRVLNLKLAKHKIPFIVTNQVYQEIGCLTNDNLVITDKGPVNIDKIKISDKVKTLFGFSNVTNKFEYKGVQNTIKFTFDDGSSIVCTKDHKFMVENKKGILWKKAEQLKNEDEIVCV